jgi:hypothetical protein
MGRRRTDQRGNDQVGEQIACTDSEFLTHGSAFIND